MTTSSKYEEFHQAQVALDKARRESERLRTEAIQELLHARKQIDAELKLLGYNGRHSQQGEANGAETSMGSARKRRGAARSGGKPHCPYCDMDGHDARAHRGQGDNKRKFTTSELYARGLGIPPRPSTTNADGQTVEETLD